MSNDDTTASVVSQVITAIKAYGASQAYGAMSTVELAEDGKTVTVTLRPPHSSRTFTATIRIADAKEI